MAMRMRSRMPARTISPAIIAQSKPSSATCSRGSTRNLGFRRRVDGLGQGRPATAKQWRDALPRENDLEGQQDQGGKHGGQEGLPKSPRPPKTTDRDEDVIRKGSRQGFKER